MKAITLYLNITAEEGKRLLESFERKYRAKNKVGECYHLVVS